MPPGESSSDAAVDSAPDALAYDETILSEASEVRARAERLVAQAALHAGVSVDDASLQAGVSAPTVPSPSPTKSLRNTRTEKRSSEATRQRGGPEATRQRGGLPNLSPRQLGKGTAVEQGWALTQLGADEPDIPSPPTKRRAHSPSPRRARTQASDGIAEGAPLACVCCVARVCSLSLHGVMTKNHSESLALAQPCRWPNPLQVSRSRPWRTLRACNPTSVRWLPWRGRCKRLATEDLAAGRRRLEG